jgi:hypothetical protein
MQNRKRILSVTIKRMIDEDPDTSWLGEYASSPNSEFSIDRAHSEDCASVREDIKQAKQTLEHIQQTIGDLHSAVLARYNGTLANEKLDAEKDALDVAYDEVGELIEDIDACDCGERGDMERGQYRYFNPSFNYVDKNGHALPENTAEEVRKYVRQDYDRMESLDRGDWCFIGIRAQAQVQTGSAIVQDITSGGLWGIESDSGREYIEEVIRKELANLKTELLAWGFSKRAISAAFKNVERKDA